MNAPAHRHHVVVGVDGSDTSTGAALWAAALASTWGCTLVVAHAIPQDGTRYSPAAVLAESQFISQLREDAEAIVDAALAAVREAYPSVDVQHSVGAGPAGAFLVDAAAHARAVVLGSTGSGAFRSLLLGSTALHVANRAPCPVTVWRGTHTHPDSSPVVVGVDGSDLSSAAVDSAFEFASFFDAPIVAVHTWQGSPSLGAGGTGLLVDWDTVAQEEEALLGERLSGTAEQYPDVPVRRVAEQGGSADTILREAADAQLIVVGSHGRGPLLGAMMGSTSQNILHHARCSVTVCRQQD